jgi:hypothetical protein
MKKREISTYKAKVAEERIALQTLKDCHQFLENKLGIKTSLYLVKQKKAPKNLMGAYHPKLNAILINIKI